MFGVYCRNSLPETSLLYFETVKHLYVFMMPEEATASTTVDGTVLAVLIFMVMIIVIRIVIRFRV